MSMSDELNLRVGDLLFVLGVGVVVGLILGMFAIAYSIDAQAANQMCQIKGYESASSWHMGGGTDVRFDKVVCNPLPNNTNCIVGC
jgi:hypothetical protein